MVPYRRLLLAPGGPFSLPPHPPPTVIDFEVTVKNVMNGQTDGWTNGRISFSFSLGFNKYVIPIKLRMTKVFYLNIR